MDFKLNIESLGEAKKELLSLEDDDLLFIEQNGSSKYVVLPISAYDLIEDQLLFKKDNAGPKVIVAGDKLQLTYQEYENLKRAINQQIDELFKPSAENMN